jgi:uncharacterized protein
LNCQAAGLRESAAISQRAGPSPDFLTGKELQLFSVARAANAFAVCYNRHACSRTLELIDPNMRLVAFCLAFFAGTVEAASFECSKVEGVVEHLICSTPELSRLDEILSSIYRRTQRASLDKVALLSSQRAWLAQRDLCASRPDHTQAACIEASYRNRIKELLRTDTPHYVCYWPEKPRDGEWSGRFEIKGGVVEQLQSERSSTAPGTALGSVRERCAGLDRLVQWSGGPVIWLTPIGRSGDGEEQEPSHCAIAVGVSGSHFSIRGVDCRAQCMESLNVRLPKDGKLCREISPARGVQPMPATISSSLQR